MQSTVVYIRNTGVRVISTGLDIETPGAQDTSHEEKDNKYKDGDIIKIVDKDILEDNVHHP